MSSYTAIIYLFPFVTLYKIYYVFYVKGKRKPHNKVKKFISKTCKYDEPKFYLLTYSFHLKL